MTDLTSLNAASTTTTTSAASGASASNATSRASIADNFDSFLLLLTTQLKNQNPLEPLDTNQFTQQLVQFASVEQQLKSNETLSALLTSTQAQNATNATSFIGKSITADGKTTQFANGNATWTLNAPRASADAVVTIRDDKGNVMFSERGTLVQGSNTYVWDGTTNAGGKAPAGSYTISITARDTAGQDMVVQTQIKGKVSGVDLSGTTPVLLIGDSRISLDALKSIDG